jgi:TonB family protein
MRKLLSLLALGVVAGCGTGEMAPSGRAPGPEPQISTLFRPAKTAQSEDNHDNRYRVPEFPGPGAFAFSDANRLSGPEWDQWSKAVLEKIARTRLKDPDSTFPKDRKFNVELMCFVRPNGKVEDVRVITGSGLPEVDAVAVKLLRAGSPLPELPAAFGGKPILFRFVLAVQHFDSAGKDVVSRRESSAASDS